MPTELPPPSLSLPAVETLLVKHDRGPGGQMKPLSPITFEKESTRMGERGLQNQFEIYCVEAGGEEANHHPRNKLLKLKNQ